MVSNQCQKSFEPFRFFFFIKYISVILENKALKISMILEHLSLLKKLSTSQIFFGDWDLNKYGI